MFQLFGLVTVIAVITGALIFSGSPAILEALPFEVALIGGAAIGTLLVGNSPRVARDAAIGLGKAVTGPKWKQTDYADLLTGMNELIRRARRGGIVSIEADIEAPESSPVFLNRPNLLADEDARNLITDSFRLLALNPGGKSPLQAHLDDAIGTIADTRHKAVTALNSLADALPALGIVAAVLGIIKTMSMIDQSPEVLGPMIATALLGTFLGVFLAYGLVGPLAARFGQVIDEEMRYLETIRTLLMAYDDGLAPATAVELARSSLPTHLRPTIETLDASMAKVESLPHRHLRGRTA
ncbi:motility-associated protein [Henriciella pelagia]|jgi:chemotaxis protein MotA|uniref:Flagellar motor protein MotA n=1 Tax=Henriciella pelagia TaxID=1977912 RepID=A0ABQ1JNE4_9PROT|nr:motility-associated protein [Henriciella pelagia]GGB71441.1 flagellar motor protein MotA [Henriciella pelagia]